MKGIYVLELLDGHYYVGYSKNIKYRIQTHIAKNGALWTKKYPPIRVMKIYENAKPKDETNITCLMMREYGIENVRGGVHTSIDRNQILLKDQTECVKITEKTMSESLEILNRPKATDDEIRAIFYQSSARC